MPCNAAECVTVKAASEDTKTQMMKVLVAELKASSRLEPRENTPPQSIEPLWEALPAVSTKALAAGHNSCDHSYLGCLRVVLGRGRRHIPWS